ncbi:MAG: hypothetical protein Q7J28_07680 [Caulobacter sp.]|nr:hypothetical protein [Caulobacter sp.]
MHLAAALLSLALLAQAEPTTTTADAQATALPTSPPAADPAAPVAGAPVAPQIPATSVKLAKGAELRIELANGVSSITSKLGDRFPIRLVEPIKASDGTVIVAAGAMGEGEVIDAAPSGMNGQQGKLVISARFLDLNGVRVRIRGMSLIAAGESRVDLSRAVSFVPYVGLASFLIKGGDIQFPTSTPATVKVAADVEVPIITASSPEGTLQ